MIANEVVRVVFCAWVAAVVALLTCRTQMGRDADEIRASSAHAKNVFVVRSSTHARN